MAEYADFCVERADKLTRPGSINDQVITALITAELVIADISTLNANAFYEIGIRHMVQKPIIHMHLVGQRIPFDIAPFRSIEFSRARPRDLREARITLKQFVDTVLSEGYEVDNPVTYARGKIQFSETATEPEKLIQDQLDTIIERIIRIEDNQNKKESAFSAEAGSPNRNRQNDLLFGAPRISDRLTNALRVRIAPLHDAPLGKSSTEINGIMSSYFDSFKKVHRDDIGDEFVVVDTQKNRAALNRLSEKAAKLPYQIEVEPFKE